MPLVLRNMSDESTASPSPLRLKPRLRPAEGASAGTAVATSAVMEHGPAVAAPVADAPAPTIRFKPRAPAGPAVTSAVAPAVAVIGGEVATPAVIGEPPKFKFKPKVAEPAAAGDPGSQLIGALPPRSPAPVEFPPSEPAPAPAVPPSVGGVPRRTLPPFPVVAGPGSSRTNPSIPVPHIRVKAPAVAEPETFEDLEAGRKGLRRLVWLLVLAAVGVGGYYGWPYLKPYVARFTAPKAEAKLAAVASPGLTPSDTLNKLAHAPAAAIDRAQDAIAARRASGQTRTDVALTGEDIPDKTKPLPASTVKKSIPAVPPPAPTMTPVTPGLAASVQLEAGADASPEFRTFVANARVSGVFQGAPPRAMINGKLTRVGETTEAGLGVIFAGLDTEKRHLIFKDRSGAIISRRY